jgi:DNA repair protein RadC
MKEYTTTIPIISLKKEQSNFKKVKITSSQDSRDYIRQFYNDDIGIYESFFLLLLNRANNTTGYVKISQGGTTGTVVDISIICKYVISSLAQHIVVSHNHPSGNITPSAQDIQLTKKIYSALQLFNIPLLDHIILSGENDNYFSFADEGLF